MGAARLSSELSRTARTTVSSRTGGAWARSELRRSPLQHAKQSKRVKRRLIMAAAAAAVIPVVALTVSNAASASPSKVAVAQGTGPAVLKDASPFGSVPANTPEQVSFVLRGQSLGGLQAAVDSGYQRTLSVSQFAAQYGQSSAVISGLEGYLKGFGITVTETFKDGLDVSTSGTAGDYDNALTVQQQWYHVPPQGGLPGQTIHGTKQTPYLPGSFGRSVLAILGLTNYAPFSTDLVHAPNGVDVSTGGSNGVQTGNYTPADFA